MKSLIDSIPTLVVYVFPDGAIEFLSQGWREYTGRRLEELAGWGWQSVIHADDLSRITEECSAAQVSGRSFHSEVRIRRADGQYRWFLIGKVPLRDENGRIVRWYVTAKDIEGRKQQNRSASDCVGLGQTLRISGA
jgi:two-component system phosphate regulon sensor histidine kinase PhoR